MYVRVLRATTVSNHIKYKLSSLVGFELTTFGLEVQRTILRATGTTLISLSYLHIIRQRLYR